MSGGRRSRGRAAALRRDLQAVAQDLDVIYPNRPAPTAAPSTPSGVHIPESGTPAPTSLEVQAHLLGPEHLGRFVEVRVPGENPANRPGLSRPAGPFAGRLVGYRAAPEQRGPGTGTPVRAFELLIQQGPHLTPVTVTWADPIRIA